LFRRIHHPVAARGNSTVDPTCIRDGIAVARAVVAALAGIDDSVAAIRRGAVRFAHVTVRRVTRLAGIDYMVAAERFAAVGPTGIGQDVTIRHTVVTLFSDTCLQDTVATDLGNAGRVATVAVQCIAVVAQF
jgi:hypothetical protein